MNIIKTLLRMPNAERTKKILSIALPITGGMISQNILNLVDAGMVGYLGDIALAATGIGGFANFMAVALVLGLSSGVQAVASRRLGEGKKEQTGIALDGGLLLALCIGIPLSFIIIYFGKPIFSLLTSDPMVAAEGTSYFQIRVASMAAVGMNFAFRGYWSALQMTQNYMKTLIFMHVINIFLNWVLIFGHLGFEAHGVNGAAIATSLAMFAGSAMYFYQGIRQARPFGFLTGIPKIHTIKNMLRISIPSSMQQLFFATGMVVLFWIVGKIGTQEMAAINILMNLTLASILPALGLGLATASLVGHALGEGNPNDALQWGWEVAGIATKVAFLIGFPLVIFSEPVLAIFLKDPSTVQLANLPLKIMGAMVWFDAIGMVAMNAQLGAGDTKRMLIITIVTQWLIFLPSAYIIGPVLGYGLIGVWLAQTAYRLLQASLFILWWHKGHWKKIRV
ncbi:MAG: MATE family efflux transporter [bacterium]